MAAARARQLRRPRLTIDSLTTPTALLLLLPRSPGGPRIRPPPTPPQPPPRRLHARRHARRHARGTSRSTCRLVPGGGRSCRSRRRPRRALPSEARHRGARHESSPPRRSQTRRRAAPRSCTCCPRCTRRRSRHRRLSPPLSFVISGLPACASPPPTSTPLRLATGRQSTALGRHSRRNQMMTSDPTPFRLCNLRRPRRNLRRPRAAPRLARRASRLAPRRRRAPTPPSPRLPRLRARACPGSAAPLHEPRHGMRRRVWRRRRQQSHQRQRSPPRATALPTALRAAPAPASRRVP